MPGFQRSPFEVLRWRANQLESKAWTNGRPSWPRRSKHYERFGTTRHSLSGFECFLRPGGTDAPSTISALISPRFPPARPRRKEQSSALHAVFCKRDSMVLLPTGAGKSVCFQLPAAMPRQSGVTIVFTPLLALARDQVNPFTSLLKGPLWK
jgi:ATP-dependent helicase YprA (DUF1998 family)